MPSHVALLRGVNVGGHNALDMAQLREVASDLGHKQIATYLRSGNLVFTPVAAADADLGADLATALAARIGLHPMIVVLTRAELAEVVAGNPFGDVTDPKTLHAVFHPGPVAARRAAAILAAQDRAREAGSPDQARLIGRTLYLSTPDGLGRSDLAARLTRGVEAGTARNWTTVTKLLALLTG